MLAQRAPATVGTRSSLNAVAELRNAPWDREREFGRSPQSCAAGLRRTSCTIREAARSVAGRALGQGTEVRAQDSESKQGHERRPTKRHVPTATAIRIVSPPRAFVTDPQAPPNPDRESHVQPEFDPLDGLQSPGETTWRSTRPGHWGRCRARAGSAAASDRIGTTM